MNTRPHILVNEAGERIAVQIPYKAYEKMLEQLEDTEDLVAISSAKMEKGKKLTLDEMKAKHAARKDD